MVGTYSLPENLFEALIRCCGGSVLVLVLVSKASHLTLFGFLSLDESPLLFLHVFNFHSEATLSLVLKSSITAVLVYVGLGVRGADCESCK